MFSWKLLFVLLLIPSTAFNAFAKKKVLILYSTGGHATAAKSIEKMLQSKPDEFDVVRHDFADELTGYKQWYFRSGYDLLCRHASWLNDIGVAYLWKSIESKSMFISERTFATSNQPEKILKFVESTHPDVIVSTHFAVAEVLAWLREKGHFKETPIAWTHLDAVSNIFYKQIGDQLDMTFLPTQEMKEEWSRVIDAEKLLATGIPIMPELLEQTPYDHFESLDLLNLDREAKTILLMGGSMGALDYFEIIENISKNFEQKGQQKIQFIAICGRNSSIKKQLDSWAPYFRSNSLVLTTGFVNSCELRRLQAASDLIITKPGGLSIFEIITSGRPFIMTGGIGLQEVQNATFLANKGVGYYLKTPKEVGRGVVDLLQDEDLQSAMLVNQVRIKATFNLEAIVEWVRNAQVIQAERPSQTVYEKEKEMSLPL